MASEESLIDTKNPLIFGKLEVINLIPDAFNYFL